jgi:hypothetical protein
MHQAKGCFSLRLQGDLRSLKLKLTQVRMPSAKMEMPQERGKTPKPVTSNRSPAGSLVASKDLLINDPSTTDVSASDLLEELKKGFSSINIADVLARLESTYKVALGN